MSDHPALRIGVLGATSYVYERAVRPAILATPGVELVHEASRSATPGVRDGVRLSGNYDAVLDDPAVDLVYVPLPNHLHEQWAVSCADAQKHVLVEKPLAPDADTARRMASACAQANVVLLEAYMSPYHPRSVAVLQAVRDGTIGTLRDGTARMTGMLDRDDHRWTASNGGGALLDVGIYCLEPLLTAARWDGTVPRRIAAASRWAGDPDDPVDDATSAWLELADGTTLALHVDLTAPDQQRLQLTGDGGAIEVDVRHATPSHLDDSYVLRAVDGTTTRVPTDSGDCYAGMLAHVRDVVNGESEALRPVGRSIQLAAVLDAIAAAARAG